MAVLTARGVKVGLKYGYGFEEFYNKYGLDESALRREISYRIYPKNSQCDEILQQIADNTKKRQKRKRRGTTGQPQKEPAANLTVLEIRVPSRVIEDMSSPDNDGAKKLVTMLAALHDRREVSLSEMAELDQEIGELTATRNDKTATVEQLGAEIADLKNALQIKSSQRTLALSERDKLDRAIGSARKRRGAVEEELDEIDRAIAGLGGA